MRVRRRWAVSLVLLGIGLLSFLGWQSWRPADDDDAADSSAREPDDSSARTRADVSLAALPRTASSGRHAGITSSEGIEPSTVNPKTTIEGRVVGIDGVPVARVCLTAFRLDPRMPGGPFPEWSIGVTDENGCFRLLGLDPTRGETNAWIVVEKRKRERASIVDAPLGATDVEIRLKPIASAKIRVVDDRDSPVAGALVRSSIDYGWAEGTSILDVTGTDGVATLEGVDVFKSLDDWRASVAVRPPASRSGALLPARLSDWDGGDATIRLERSLDIEGVVRDLDGRPVARAIVYACQDGAMDEAECDGFGRFRLSEVASGAEVRLWAAVRGGHDRSVPSDAKGVRAGDRHVSLTIDVGGPLVVTVDGWPKSALGWATLTREGDGETPRTRSVSVQNDGTVRFEAVVAGSYSLWVPAPAGESVCVFETGLRPGSTPSRVSTRPTRDLRVVEDSKELAMLMVVAASIGGVTVAENAGDDHDARRLRGVPEGLVVRVSVAATLHRESDNDPLATGEADAAPGETTVRVPIAVKGATK